MGEYELLSKIKSPHDVKKLNDEQLEKLCTEIREKLVETVSVNGGHLSPNLGVVELTVALERSFNLPKDSIVWDVGHQAYTHKLLRDATSSLTQSAKKAEFQAFRSVPRANTTILTQATAVHQYQPHTELQEQNTLWGTKATPLP